MSGSSSPVSLYPLLVLGGILLSAVAWIILLRRDQKSADRRLTLVYLACLVGAILGAKVVYFLAEGWLPREAPAASSTDLLRRLLAGKTVLGALLGGYLSVEITKKLAGYPGATGDFFAVIAPLGLTVGRVGCWIHGCCLGKTISPAWYTLTDAAGLARWPAVPVEIAFNALFLAFAACSVVTREWRGQLFHLYLISYGLFRFAHEFLRETPRIFGSLSGYHIASLLVFLLGAVRFRQRRAAMESG
jgi:phosphatidylglycerol:prolipoprotein diacylglycerol transferase